MTTADRLAKARKQRLSQAQRNTVTIAGVEIQITVHRISTGRFGTFGLYYAQNSYGEPRMSHDCYSTAQEAFETEVEDLTALLS